MSDRDELAKVIQKALGDVTGIFDTSEAEDLGIADAILAAGFGSVREAQAQALEDVDNYVDQVMFHSDTETNTGPLVAGRGPLINLLNERAKALRAEGETK